MTNCPNCGAPISGIKCEYCGTAFLNLVDISTGGNCIVRFRHGNEIITGEMCVGNINAEVNYIDPVIGRDWTGRLHYREEVPPPIVKMNISFISLGKMTTERSGANGKEHFSSQAGSDSESLL